MRTLRVTALTVVALLTLVSIAGSLMPGFDYAHQDREHVATGPSSQHWLGTDALGRDRLARLLHGTAVSLLWAPAAAVLSMLLAFSIGAAPGFLGGFSESAARTVIDLVLSIPWLFLLLLVRALLPLNTPPATSAAITFLVLGLLGWGMPARILLARSRRLCRSDFFLLARSTGVSRWRLLCVHGMPNLWPVLFAQFCISVPVFILAEANLSMLGLGVAEPLPSLGSLLRELETVISFRTDVCSFAALLVLMLIVGSLQIVVSKSEVF